MKTILLISVVIFLSGCSNEIDVAWDNLKKEIDEDLPFVEKKITTKDFKNTKPKTSEAGFRGFYEFYDPEYKISIRHNPKWNNKSKLLFHITSLDYNSAREIRLRKSSITLTDDRDRTINYDAKDIDSLDLKHSSRLEITFRNTDAEYINVYFKAPDFYTKTPFVMSVPNPANLTKEE